MRDAAREGESCPMCGTGLRITRCGPCHGTGRSGSFFKRDCKTWRDQNNDRVPEFLLSPRFGPAGFSRFKLIRTDWPISKRI